MSYVLLSFCTKLGLQLISFFCKPILGIDICIHFKQTPLRHFASLVPPPLCEWRSFLYILLSSSSPTEEQFIGLCFYPSPVGEVVTDRRGTFVIPILTPSEALPLVPLEEGQFC